MILCCLMLFCSSCSSTKQTQTDATDFLLIDPGHGGFDGGAVAEDGTLEKHINLKISLFLRDMLSLCGIPVEMTRDTDIGLVVGTENTIRQKKVNDLQRRLALYNQAKQVISVHQNLFSVSKYSGAQVFYSGNHPDSAVLADCIQQSVCHQLQPDNHREIKQASNGIYLLHHTTTPAVLVECGFLSNPGERQRLLTESYQQEMAFAIMMGYFTFSLEK